MHDTKKILALALILLCSLAYAEWSATGYFRVQLKGPDLIEPIGDAVLSNPTPTFIWFELPGASKYHLLVIPSGSTEPIINDSTLTDTTYTPSVSLTPGDYYWLTYAKDSFNNWGNPSESRLFTITSLSFGDLSNNLKTMNQNYLRLSPPSLITPTNGSYVYSQTPYFDWQDVAGVSYYHIQIDEDNNFASPFIDEYVLTSEYQVLSANSLPETLYYWRVSQEIIGWVQEESMPTGVSSPKPKYVKDGGAMVGVGSNLYAFRGNKSREFYKFDINSEQWFGLESVPFAPKANKPDKPDKKYAKKGAALCYDGANYIFATKGGGTFEFWMYNMISDTWIRKNDVPSTQKLKGGTSIAYYDGKVYLLAGGHKPTDATNFFGYDTTTNTWVTLKKVQVAPTYKPWKDGSCLVELDGTIYALKGGDKANPFFAYNIEQDSWINIESIPIYENLYGKNKKVLVKDGGAMTGGDGVIYAIKGGSANVFWKYTPGTKGTWTSLESIPRLHKKSVPKTGAALAYADGKVHLLKGNNTPEFWCYTPPLSQECEVQRPIIVNNATAGSRVSNIAVSNLMIKPNPSDNYTIIQYNVSVSGKVSLKLYNASGRLIETLGENNVDVGTYSHILPTTKMAKGVYFIRLVTDNGKNEAKLIVQ